MKFRPARLLKSIDVLLWPFVYLSGLLLKKVRYLGVHRLPRCRKTLLDIGVFPIRDHYYEPQFDHRNPKKPFSEDRALPGIDWNVDGQVSLLKRLSFAKELTDVPTEKPSSLDFYFNNGSFESGDAEYWYQLIRSIKPRRIFEVGSGNSTLMAIRSEKVRGEW